MKSIDHAPLSGQKVIVRVDYNVPLNEQFEVTDTTRISRTKPTVDKIINEGGIPILMSHLGRPKGEVNDKYSLRHVVNTASEILDYPVVFLGDVTAADCAAKIAKMPVKSVGLLENLRFHKEEEEGNVAFAKTIADLGDIYVNDAFGTAHREHASTATIAQFFKGKAFAGYLLFEEITALEKVLNETHRPFTAIIGGSKVSSKLNILKHLITKVDNLIIAGGMSYTFLAALDVKIGNSLFEPDMVKDAKTIIKQAHRLGVDLFIPIDNVCGDSFSKDANVFITDYNDIPDGWEGLDIGPRTIQKFSSYITHSNTILWNGPVGVFEFEKFGKGTKSIALAVAAASLTGTFSLLGGGDSIAAVNQYNLADYMSYISTGGGAMLEYLEGIELPGIKALHDNE